MVKLTRQNKLRQPSLIHQVSLSKAVILSNLFKPNTWLVCTNDGSPLLTSVASHVNFSGNVLFPLKLLMTGKTPLHSSLVSFFNLYNNSLMSRVSLNRVFYDKGFNGRNIKKCYSDKPDTCNNFHLPDSIFHWMCQCSHITQ